MKTPAQWREIYPVAEEVVRAIQDDTICHMLDILEKCTNGIFAFHINQISPHPILPVSQDPAQRVADPAGNPGSGGREGGEG